MNTEIDTPPVALGVALRFHRAWTGGDLDSAMSCLSDDFVCQAPGQDIVGNDAYREYLGGFAQMMTGLTDVAAFGDDDHAVLFYYPHTAVTSTAPAAEHFTVTDGKIAHTRLVFDRLSFAPPEGR